MELKNFFQSIPFKIENEILETLIENRDFKLERIISEGHISSPGFWYDQDKNEFVLLLSGSAKLLFYPDEEITLKSGDYLIIPAHKKHRVAWTDKSQKTFWLTLYY